MLQINDLGRTLVHQLAYESDPTTESDRAQQMRDLLTADPSPLHKLDRDGRTPLDAARSINEHQAPGFAVRNQDIMRTLADFEAPSAESISQTAQLMTHGEAEAIVLAWREEMASKERFGTEASAWASRQNRHDVLRQVSMEQQQKIQPQDLDRWMVEACQQKRGMIVEILGMLGANPNQVVDEKNHTTLLHAAARQGHQGMIVALTKNGAKVDEKDLAGNSPLIFAAQSRNPSAVAALLRAGANAKQSNNENRDAYQVADSVRLMPSMESLVARVSMEAQRSGITPKHQPSVGRTVALEI